MSSNRLDTLTPAWDLLPEGIFVVKLAGSNPASLTYVYVNQACSEVMGFDTSTVIGRHVSEVSPAVIEGGFHLQIAKVKETQKTIELGVFPYQGTLVSRRWLCASLFPIFGDYVGVCARDVSEHKQNEIERDHLLDRYRALSSVVPDLLLVLNKDRILLACEGGGELGRCPAFSKEPNRVPKCHATRMLNPPHNPCAGKHLREVFPAQFFNVIDLAIREALMEPPKACHFTFHDDESHLDYEGRAAATESGEIVVTILRNVTTQRAFEKELEDRVARRTSDLAQSNYELQQFAYAASHDLREPLHKITAFGGRLSDHLEGQLDEKGQQYLGILINASSRLERLIDDLLDYSRAGQLEEAAPVEVNLNEFIPLVLEDLSERVLETKADIQIATELPTLWVHPSRLRRVLINLVSNALKFHKPGGVPQVAINSWVDGDSFKISVQDQGIGFDPKFTDHIFHVFTRLHTRFDYPGTGIGLALCRRLVERYGGSIEALGKPGEGTTFTVILPKVFPLEMP